MFEEDEIQQLEKFARESIGAIPLDILSDASPHRAAGTPPPSPEAAKLAQIDEASEALLDFRNNRRSLAFGWARGFATRFLIEIRSAICGAADGKLLETGKVTAQGAATAVAGWLMGMFGLSNPIAMGLAGLVVLALGRAVRSSFCAMTEDEIRAALHST